MEEGKAQRVTYFSKNPIDCPVCETSFHREDLLTGRGRLIAGDLTEELRRLYTPGKKYGEIYPLVYPVSVCPSCYYAAYPQDFGDIEGDEMEAIRAQTDERINAVSLVLQELDFTAPRTLKEGIASYFLSLMCYEHFALSVAPSFKRGLSALRCAWCLTDLHGKYPEENYDYLAKMFYRKARFFYTYSVDTMQSGQEGIDKVANFGPDLDHNWGYDGFLYLAGLLELRFGPATDVEKRTKALDEAKRIISRIFGSGKASKGKPSAILDLARDAYDAVTVEIKSVTGAE